VACNRDRLASLLDGCERFLLDPIEIAQRLVGMLKNHIANPGDADDVVSVGYKAPVESYEAAGSPTRWNARTVSRDPSQVNQTCNEPGTQNTNCRKSNLATLDTRQ
jgi:hypothetical protein